jgi:hypothetical protein
MEGIFLIGGHGGEPRKTFVVPDGCIIIVHVHYGDKINRDKHFEIFSKLYRLKKEVLHDPLTLNHLPILFDIYQRIAIYQAGDTCPDLSYLLFDCPDSTECYNMPMGVIDMDIWSNPPRFARINKLPKSPTQAQIIEHFSKPYRDSIYPTKEQVEAKVREIIEHVARNKEESTVRDVIEQKPRSLLRAIFKGIEDYTHTTQSELCAFRKGVYYHSICREKKDITKRLSSSIISIPQITRFINQVRNRPVNASHTRKKANSYVSLKLGISNALKSRIGETVKHRTPFIKQWMNSPVYQEKRKEDIEIRKSMLERHIQQYNIMLHKHALKISEIDDKVENKSEPWKIKKTKKELQNDIERFKKIIDRLRKNRNNLNDVKSVEAERLKSQDNS